MLGLVILERSELEGTCKKLKHRDKCEAVAGENKTQ